MAYSAEKTQSSRRVLVGMRSSAAGVVTLKRIEKRLGGGEEKFAGLNLGELVDGQQHGVGAGEFGGAEVSRGEVEQRYGRSLTIGVQGTEEVVAVRAEGRIDGGAGGEDAGDLAANDLLGELGVFHLLADGDAVALAQKAGDVGLGGVVGDSAHGDGAFPIPGGEGNLQLAGGGLRVVKKEFVKVAHAEEEQGVRIERFGPHVLAHEGGKRGGGGGLGGVDGFAGRSWDGIQTREMPAYRERHAGV